LKLFAGIEINSRALEELKFPGLLVATLQSLPCCYYHKATVVVLVAIVSTIKQYYGVLCVANILSFSSEKKKERKVDFVH
jgi:hypothetical protein